MEHFPEQGERGGSGALVSRTVIRLAFAAEGDLDQSAASGPEIAPQPLTATLADFHRAGEQYGISQSLMTWGWRRLVNTAVTAHNEPETWTLGPPVNFLAHPPDEESYWSARMPFSDINIDELDGYTASLEETVKGREGADADRALAGLHPGVGVGTLKAWRAAVDFARQQAAEAGASEGGVAQDGERHA